MKTVGWVEECPRTDIEATKKRLADKAQAAGAVGVVEWWIMPYQGQCMCHHERELNNVVVGLKVQVAE